MKGEKIYTVGQIKNLIRESSQEFSPKLGVNVSRENMKNNEDSYKDSEKRSKDFNGSITLPNKPKNIKNDYNKTTLDSSFTYDPGKEYKDRVKAQAKGYSSKMEEDNDIEKDGDFNGNEAMYDELKKSHEKMAKNALIGKKAGLAAREMPPETFDRDSMFENKLRTKRLTFKHSVFLGEEHMLSHIPDEFKINGQRLIMKDSADNEYLVEWVVDDNKNISEGNVISYSNKRKLNEELNRIKDLYNYKSSDYFNTTNAQSRLFEDKKVESLIEQIRNTNN